MARAPVLKKDAGIELRHTGVFKALAVRKGQGSGFTTRVISGHLLAFEVQVDYLHYGRIFSRLRKNDCLKRRFVSYFRICLVGNVLWLKFR